MAKVIKRRRIHGLGLGLAALALMLAVAFASNKIDGTKPYEFLSFGFSKTAVCTAPRTLVAGTRTLTGTACVWIGDAGKPYGIVVALF